MRAFASYRRSREGSCCALRPRRWLEIEAVCELAEHVDEPLDLRLRVRRCDLNPEADLVSRNERIGGEGDVDAVLEEESADRVDVLAVTERDLDDRKAGVVRRVGAEPVECGVVARRPASSPVLRLPQHQQRAAAARRLLSSARAAAVTAGGGGPFPDARRRATNRTRPYFVAPPRQAREHKSIVEPRK